MSKIELLNNVDHKDLRIDTRRGAGFEDEAQMVAVTFPAEFRNIQTHYPIVFAKSPEGSSFQPLALLGFEEGQNLFLGDAGWDAHYIPLAIQRQPFLIGREGPELMIHVDMASPRVVKDEGRGEGEPVFLPHGGNTEYLERTNSVLQALHEGLESTPAFINALLAHELLESFVLDVELPNGSQSRLAGFYTINEERLNALGGAALEGLHRAGHLQPIFMAIASLSNLRALIERRIRRGG